jgi:hypothetical protein
MKSVKVSETELSAEELERAQKTSQRERDRHQIEQRLYRKNLTDLFWKIFITSPILISLSITFLGFLIARQGNVTTDFGTSLDLKTILVIQDEELIALSWFALLVAIVGSLMRNLLAPRHTTTATVLLYGRSRQDIIKAEMRLVESGQVFDKTTNKQITEVPGQLAKGYEITHSEIIRLSKREVQLKWLVSALEAITILSFVIGVVLLVKIAWSNLPPLYLVTRPY